MLAAIKADSVAQTAPARPFCPTRPPCEQTAHGQRVTGTIRRCGFSSSLTRPDSGSTLAARIAAKLRRAVGAGYRRS